MAVDDTSPGYRLGRAKPKRYTDEELKELHRKLSGQTKEDAALSRR